MGSETKIAWCDHTFNAWIGCEKVSAGCTNCYAESYDKRVGGGINSDGVKRLRWGRGAERVRTSAANWRKPLAWNKAAAADGVRRRVFCASLADVFDDAVPSAWRIDLFNLIESTPQLDWLLLTKRPENFNLMNFARVIGAPFDWPANVWPGTTVENQKQAERRIPLLIEQNATVRFISCEPLLETVNLGLQSRYPWSGEPPAAWRDVVWPGWVPKSVRAEVEEFWSEKCGRSPADWARSMDGWGSGVTGLRRPAIGERGVFESHYGTVLGRYVHAWNNIGRVITDDGDVVVVSEAFRAPGIDWLIIGGESGPKARPFHLTWARSLVKQARDAGVAPFVKQLGARPKGDGFCRDCADDGPICPNSGLPCAGLRDRAGADPSEWPADLRVQEWPEVRR